MFLIPGPTLTSKKFLLLLKKYNTKLTSTFFFLSLDGVNFFDTLHSNTVETTVCGLPILVDRKAFNSCWTMAVIICAVMDHHAR
jgi:hypothetical protein